MQQLDLDISPFRVGTIVSFQKVICMIKAFELLESGIQIYYGPDELPTLKQIECSIRLGLIDIECFVDSSVVELTQIRYEIPNQHDPFKINNNWYILVAITDDFNSGEIELNLLRAYWKDNEVHNE